MKCPVDLLCSDHYEALHTAASGHELRCSNGCQFPVVGGIPRFVDSDNYASSFGLQWRVFAKTQLDSYSGMQVSRQRLERLLGGSFEIVKKKLVLEVGCGAGRFTEVLLAEGARVFSSDLSNAVEANYSNCGDNPNHFVCQADLFRLPVAEEQFDVVVCIGVLQHTPDPEEAITKLSRNVKPGGLLVIDHYLSGPPPSLSRRLFRPFLLKRSPQFSMYFCKSLVALLWPLHRLTWKLRRFPLGKRVYGRFAALSPVADYQGVYPEARPDLMREWAVLDTHDMLTDAYKHTRDEKQIRKHLESCGLEDIDTCLAGNGVEARAKKPRILSSHDSPTRTARGGNDG
jgi:SAM-dependent methyltransferase